jgi:hypothetical protein
VSTSDVIYYDTLSLFFVQPLDHFSHLQICSKIQGRNEKLVKFKSTTQAGPTLNENNNSTAYLSQRLRPIRLFD